MVEPRRLQRVRQDLTHVATLACLIAWRQASRERPRQQQGTAPAGAGGQQLVARGVQTHGLSLGEVRELVTAFRALADSSNPSTRLCAASLNLLDHYLSKEAWGAVGGGGGAD
mgnify:CR=1 FL=1